MIDVLIAPTPTPEAVGTLIFWFTLGDFDKGMPTRSFAKGPLWNAFYTVHAAYDQISGHQQEGKCLQGGRSQQESKP